MKIWDSVYIWQLLLVIFINERKTWILKFIPQFKNPVFLSFMKITSNNFYWINSLFPLKLKKKLQDQTKKIGPQWPSKLEYQVNFYELFYKLKTGQRRISNLIIQQHGYYSVCKIWTPKVRKTPQTSNDYIAGNGSF